MLLNSAKETIKTLAVPCDLSVGGCAPSSIRAYDIIGIYLSHCTQTRLWDGKVGEQTVAITWPFSKVYQK